MGVLSLWWRQRGGGDDCLRPPGHAVFGGKERRRASRGRSTCSKVADPAAQFQRRLPEHPGYGRGSGEPLQLRSPGVPERGGPDRHYIFPRQRLAGERPGQQWKPRRRAAVGTPAWAEVQGLGGGNRPGRLHFNGQIQLARNGRRSRLDFSVAWSAAPAVAASRKMRARVELLGGGKGGMVVMELGLFTGTAVTAGSLAALRADRRVKRLEVEPTKLVLYFDEILEGETIELEAETVSPVANLQQTSSIVYEYYQPENQALAISRSDDSSGTFVREKAVDAEEAIDGRQIIDSAAGALAPKLFSAAAGAGIALMALV